MLNQAIVISKIKYRDNDLIVKCYTLERGISSFLIRGAFKSKSTNSIAYYQSLSQLQIEVNYQPNKSLHYIKDVKLNYVYTSLHTNVLKSSIVMFLSEVLTSVLKEEEPNQLLFEYIKTALCWLDSENHYANFHLLFLLKLTKYLGFYPDASNQNEGVFNLEKGAFEVNKPNKFTISTTNNILIKQLLGMNFDAIDSIKLSAEQRQSFLNFLMVYYELHLGDFKKPKSLEVFNQVFK